MRARPLCDGVGERFVRLGRSRGHHQHCSGSADAIARVAAGHQRFRAGRHHGADTACDLIRQTKPALPPSRMIAHSRIATEHFGLRYREAKLLGVAIWRSCRSAVARTLMRRVGSSSRKAYQRVDVGPARNRWCPRRRAQSRPPIPLAMLVGDRETFRAERTARRRHHERGRARIDRTSRENWIATGCRTFVRSPTLSQAETRKNQQAVSEAKNQRAAIIRFTCIESTSRPATTLPAPAIFVSRRLKRPLQHSA